DWALSRLTFRLKRIIDVAPLFSLGLQSGSMTQVRLVSEHDKKFGELSIGRVFHHPRRKLAYPGSRCSEATLTNRGRRAPGRAQRECHDCAEQACCDKRDRGTNAEM